MRPGILALRAVRFTPMVLLSMLVIACGDSEGLQDETIPRYIFIFHVDPVAVGDDDLDRVASHYNNVVSRVDYANQYDIKLSLWLGHAFAEYLERSEERLSELGKWIEAGHEIGIHHHSVYKPRCGSGVQHQWDGYSSLVEDEAIKTRAKMIGRLEDVELWGYLGDFNEYMKVFEGFEERFGIEINLGIANEQFNKTVSMPDELIYSGGSGFVNNAEPGRWEEDDTELTKGINEYISKGLVNGIERKWITHYTVTEKHYEKDAEELFDTLDPHVVFVAVTHDFNDFEAFKAYIDFLHSRDPDASRNLTVKQVMESGILPEKEIHLRCEELGGTVCNGKPGTDLNCDDEWLIDEEDFRCCGGYCLPSNEGSDPDT